MHVLTFMYPSAPGETFNIKHYFDTHLPMGAGLAKKFLDIDVSKMIIQQVRGPEDGGIPAPYFVLCHVIVKSKEEADRIAGIFAFDEAAKRLSEDWPKYTPLAPQAMVSEWTVLEDMDALRTRFTEVLEPEYAASAAE
jgi:uncharacterized protein (TIGR02118 family)